MQIEGITAAGQIRSIKLADDGSVVISGGGGGGGSGVDRELIVTTYRVSTAFAGASVGDIVTETQVVDVSGTPSTVGVLWRNQTTDTDFGSAPSNANLTQIEQSGLTDAQLRASPLPISQVNDVIAGPSGLSAANTDLITGTVNGWFDARKYKYGTIQIAVGAGLTAGTVNFEQTNDPSATAISLFVLDAGSAPTVLIAGLNLVSSTSRIYAFEINASYIRLRVGTALVGATAQVFCSFSQSPSSLYTGLQYCVGSAAHSAPSSGSPVRIAGRVNSSVDTTLVAGDTADVNVTTGMQVVVKQFSPSELDFQNSLTLTTTTAQAARVAGGASIRCYCTAVTVQNTNATATTFIILDGSTPIFTISLPASMALPINIPFPTPLRGSANTAMNVNCGTAGANVLVNIQGYIGF